jgi:hypothetical protein
MTLRTWMLAAAAAGVTASLYARAQHHNMPRHLRGEDERLVSEPGEADELMGSADEQEQPGAYSETSERPDFNTLSGLGRDT